jgi:uncharacterized protein YdgA (DUF945 family)
VNKSVIGASAAAVLVVGYVGASWGLGRMVHSGFDNWEQELAQRPNGILKVAERKYTPGVFSSVEEVTFEFNRAFFDQAMKSRRQRAQQENGDLDEDAEDAADEPKAPVHFTLRNEVTHGPLPGFTSIGTGRIHTTVLWSKEVREELDKVLPGREPVEVSTLLGLLGSMSSHITSPAFDFKDEKTTVAWKGFEGDFSVGRNLGTMDCDATAPGFSVVDTDGKGGKLEKLKITCEGKRIFDALYDGTINFEVANFETSSKDAATALRFRNLSYATDVRADGEYIDMALKATIGALSVAQTDLSDIKYHFTLRHLHGPTYAALTRKMQNMTLSTVGGDPTASLAIAGAFAEYGPQLLEHSPQLVIDRIGFSTPEGELGIKGTAELEGFTKDDFATAQSRAALIGKIVANADVWFSEGLLNKDWSKTNVSNQAAPPAEQAQGPSKVEAMRQQVAALEQQGFVTRKDGQFRSHIEFKGGQLTANGKPLK